VEIHPSARKHGIADEDIEHAVTNAMTVDQQERDTRLYLGVHPGARSSWKWSRSCVSMTRNLRFMQWGCGRSTGVCWPGV